MSKESRCKSLESLLKFFRLKLLYLVKKDLDNLLDTISTSARMPQSFFFIISLNSINFVEFFSIQAKKDGTNFQRGSY